MSCPRRALTVASLWTVFVLAAALLRPTAAFAADPPVFLDDDVAVGQLLDLVAERLELMPQVAVAKWRARAPIADPPREQALLDAMAAAARGMGLDPLATRGFFALQIRLARDAQLRLHGEWLKTGCGPCATPVDLGAIRQQIDAVNRSMLRSIYLAEPVLTRDDFPNRVRPRVEARLGRLLPDPEDRSALIDVLHAMHRNGGPSLERVRASGALRIGTTGDYDPFSLETEGHLVGADIELGRALAAQLGVEPVFVRTSWPTLVQDLAADRFDVAVSGIAINPERAAVGAFSVPYQSGGKTILARCAERSRFDSLRRLDRREVTVIVNPGGTNERYVRANVHRAHIVVFPDNRRIFDEIIAGRADAMITDDVEAELQARRHPELCRALPGTLTHGDKAVYMARDTALNSAVDAWLSRAVAAGLASQWLEQAMGH